MWLYYSLFFAIWTSFAILIAKNQIKSFGPVLFFAVSNLFIIPFQLLILFYTGVPSFTLEFYKLLFIVTIIDAIAAVLYYKALEKSDISLISPIAAFNPVFTLIFAVFLLGEKQEPIKILGILAVVAGAYFLNIANIKEGLLKPFTKLFSDRGVQLFLIANLLWGITPIFQKKATQETDPISFMAVPLGELILLTFVFSFIIFRAKDLKEKVIANKKWLIIFGIMTAFAQFAAMSAFNSSNLAYATAIFKLSTLFSIILGALFFHERRIKERFLGAMIMVAGTILIAL
jgi:drug/metabolite transporter (DMT)-like permease